MSRLAGKVAIVTGGAQGMGEATVRLFVEHGAKVVIGDVGDEAGQALAAELGDSAAFVHQDRAKESVSPTWIGPRVISMRPGIVGMRCSAS